MALNIHTPAAIISASTSTARIALPVGATGKFIRIVNGSATSPVYVNAGDVTVNATTANVSIPAFGEKTFERDVYADTYVAALLDSGTAKIMCMIVGNED
ncbi:hypothetical protein UFOVP191_3 [uncultured Caudovirales phage]|uniref:Uncharacterized protein n=1 Tax=uncultured Caudovirales phage TaxID=2100421 RepID=A0A6J7WF08_9CAUD|nr:hypothetical protein UFOVP191_3 [uncultured Caudovirales phage]